VKADTAARAYIVCLLLALAGDIAVLPLPILDVASVPLSFFLVLAGAVFPMLRPREFRAFISRRKVLIILAALFLLSGALSAVFSPFSALFGLRWLARYAVFLSASFLLLFLFFLERRRIDFFLKALLGLALFLALIALIEAASEGFSRFLAAAFREGHRELYSGRIRAAATLDNPNTLGCFMALAVLLAVVVRRRFGMGLGLFIPAVVLASAALILSGSRNALVVLLVPLAALLFNRRTIGAALGALGIIVLSLIALAPSGSRFAYLWKSAPTARLNTAPVAADSRSYDALRARKMLRQSSLAMFRDHPLFGVGPGGVSRAMSAYASAELLAMDGGKIELRYLNAHNGAINILAEFGGVGALLALLIFLYPAAGIVRRYGLFPPEPEHALVLSILLSFVVDAFFYSMLYMTAATTLFFLLGSSEEGGVRFRPAPSTQPDPQQQGQ
jgi:O-antigen ligase